MRNLFVVIALGVALLVFSVVAITVPRETLLRAGDAAQPYIGALARVGEVAVEGARDAARRLWGTARRLAGTSPVPSPTPSGSTRASRRCTAGIRPIPT